MIEGEGVAKAVGILAGTFLSLVFIPPRTVAGFFRRLTAAFVFGWLFGHIALSIMIHHLDVDKTPENVTAAWAIASFSSWTLMSLWRGIIQRRTDSV